jgi:hypothetical protein
MDGNWLTGFDLRHSFTRLVRQDGELDGAARRQLA